MKVTFESKGDFNNVLKWLNNSSNRNPSMVANQIAREGERNLSAHTPRGTGETAAGWKAIITQKGSMFEIGWINTARPGLGVNLAKLIELGHGTGTGGYVPPKPYIKNAMSSVWGDMDRLLKELVK